MVYARVPPARERDRRIIVIPTRSSQKFFPGAIFPGAISGGSRYGDFASCDDMW